MQEVIVFLALGASLAYAGWWVWQRIEKSKDPCEGCTGCQLKELKDCQKKKKSCCGTKK